ncbi:hypothetical protein ALP76_200034 [Pseudomonas savastanoi pv. glycinea]|nr:silent information regulator protein Sir2 [Pseudomonas savastanoi pv. glycinea str. race 4]KPX44686.1 hypothetical protein ALO37_200236 [Pseudomonas savastanoi pv. glycinea]MBN4178375.1 hypothetical protein [Pseudomonas savastanoi pv. phaseolicola]RMR92774.1 hypothetical protein ALP76_200034 [Pseudomonas savastanoi pv. glycinea]
MNNLDRAIEALTAVRKVAFYLCRHLCRKWNSNICDKLNGLWEKHDPDMLETAQAFRHNPQLVWGVVYGGLPKLAKPNQTPHTALEIQSVV